MEILVLGSGGVSSVSSYPGYLVDRTVLVDCPPGTTKKFIWEGIDPCSITDVVITHFHADHYFDLPFLFLARYKKTEDTLRVHCPEEGLDIIPRILELAYPDIPLISIPFELDHSGAFRCGGYSFTRFEVVHGCKGQSYAYLVEGDGARAGFSGDSSYCPALEEIAGNCECFICECTRLTGSEKHMGVDTLLKLKAGHPSCRIYATHMTDGARSRLQELGISGIEALNDSQLIRI